MQLWRIIEGVIIFRVQALPPWGCPRSRADGSGGRCCRRGRWVEGLGEGVESLLTAVGLELTLPDGDAVPAH